MQTYEFTLVLKGLSEISDDLADSLFASGCDDGTPSCSQGVAVVAFDRESDSFETAVRSPIANVQAAGCVVERVEIEADAAMLKD